MSSNTKRYATIVAFGILSACRAGGAGGDTGGPGNPPPTGFADFAAQASALHNKWDSAAFTDPATLPYGGTASFDGVLGLRLQTAQADLFMNGDLRLEVEFATDQVSGQANRFMDQGEHAVAGSLTITGGVLDRTADPATQYTYSANIGGTLDASSDSFAISGDLYGDFSGSNHQSATGIVAGTANSGFGVGYVFGDFIAEQ